MDAVAPTMFPYEASGHSVHSSLPFEALYLPSTHAKHPPPSGPVYPTSHLQSPTAELDSAETAFAGHAMHILLLAAE